MEPASDAMEIEWLILADAAQMVGGKLYLLGGGWDRVTPAKLPIDHKMSVAVAFNVPWHETNRRHSFHISIEDEDGDQKVDIGGQFEVGRPAGTPTGGSQRSQLVVDVTLPISKQGTNVIIAQIGDVAERRCTFTVFQGPSSPPQLPPP